jgi:hypothetical protein
LIVLAGQKSMASALPAEWKVRETGAEEEAGEASVMMTEARLRMPGAMAAMASSMESAGAAGDGGVGDGGVAAGGGGESAARGEARPRERARNGRRRMGVSGVRIYLV